MSVSLQASLSLMPFVIGEKGELLEIHTLRLISLLQNFCFNAMERSSLRNLY